MSFYQQANAAEDRNKTPSYNGFKEVHPCPSMFIGVRKLISVGRKLIEFPTRNPASVSGGSQHTTRPIKTRPGSTGEEILKR